jgi:hypothetical protein
LEPGDLVVVLVGSTGCRLEFHQFIPHRETCVGEGFPQRVLRRAFVDVEVSEDDEVGLFGTGLGGFVPDLLGGVLG